MIQKKSLKDAIQNPEIISVVGGLLPIGFHQIYTRTGEYKISLSKNDNHFSLLIWSGNAGQGGLFVATLSAVSSSRQVKCLSGATFHLQVYFKINDNGLYDFWIKGREATHLIIYVMRDGETPIFVSEPVPSDATLIETT